MVQTIYDIINVYDRDTITIGMMVESNKIGGNEFTFLLHK